MRLEEFRGCERRNDMCIAIYKPIGVEFPSKKILETCFNNNPDGAGFMVATGENVEIHKGFMGFRSFWKSLRSARQKYGNDKAFVMHFRISTQGGIRKDGCHPFPLSGSMDDMRLLDTTCDVGIAHNGIINLCSVGYKKDIDYSDTMAFITEYLSLIIHDRNYYKDEDKLVLIEKLCGSRLAILDKYGHCELIGHGWSGVNGVWYSNDSYKERTYKVTMKPTTSYYPTLVDWSYCNAEWDDALDEDDKLILSMYERYDACICDDGLYDFKDYECPEVEMGDASYCEWCKSYAKCYCVESED